MGYRSEVVLAISKDILPQFLAVLEKNPKTRDLCFEYVDEVEKNYNDDGSLLLYWADIKWYDSSEEVRTLESFMGKCELGSLFEDEVGTSEESFRFVRIGDYDDDIEVRGCGFEESDSAIYLNRSIEFKRH